MPVFFQHQINDTTRLGIWKIEETEDFFKGNVPQHRDVTHPHKRLQHLAGRFLLQFLFADFPYELIQIADTRKPFLPNEEYQFSISHCGDFAAAIVSRDKRVGIDIEIPVDKISRIMYKYLTAKEHGIFNLVPGAAESSSVNTYQTPTLLWSAKEAVYKWYADGGIDFRKQIQLLKQNIGTESIDCFFSKNKTELTIHYRFFDGLVLAWVMN
jgi:phosphopantetheinyl transferase